MALGIFLNRTRFGSQMRAAAEDFRMARLLGARADAVIAIAFAISGLLTGAATFFLLAQTGTFWPTMGLNPVLVGFVATALGGLGSLPGAIIGGMAIGLVTIFLQAYPPVDLSYYRDAFAYGAVIVVLLIRPRGLFVPRSVRTRV